MSIPKCPKNVEIFKVVSPNQVILELRSKRHKTKHGFKQLLCTINNTPMPRPEIRLQALGYLYSILANAECLVVSNLIETNPDNEQEYFLMFGYIFEGSTATCDINIDSDQDVASLLRTKWCASQYL